MRHTSTLIAVVLPALLFLSLVPVCSASVIGSLAIDNCSGGGVIVTGTTIDWTLPVGGGDGCIVTGGGTNVTYAGGGPLGSGVTGTVLDLGFGGLVTDFLNFTGNPNLHFDLVSLGPGVANTVCGSTLANGPSCSVFAGSPFILTPTATGTSVSLSAFGVAHDTSAVVSNWLGAFTTQIPGVTPAEIQATIAAGGSVSSTYSGAFVITAVPEPVSLSLMGGGLIALACLRRRKARQ